MLLVCVGSGAGCAESLLLAACSTAEVRSRGMERCMYHRKSLSSEEIGKGNCLLFGSGQGLGGRRGSAESVLREAVCGITVCPNEARTGDAWPAGEGVGKVGCIGTFQCTSCLAGDA